MIVQCTSCQTKFRVPDEKIGDKPVKVRCSKCTTVFSVTRAHGLPEPGGTARPASGSAAAVKKTGNTAPQIALRPAKGASVPSMPAAPAATQRNPFSAFDPAQGPTGEPTTPYFFRAGVEASKIPPTDLDVTNPGVDMAALEASRRPKVPTLNEFKVPDVDPFAHLDLSGLGGQPGAPPPPPPAPGAAPDPFAQVTLGPPPLPSPVRPTESDPFANFDLSAPGTKAAASALVSGSDPFSQLDLGPPAAPAPAAPASDPFANFDLGGPAPAAPASAASVSDPFADLSFGAPPPASATLPSEPPPAAADSDPFANLDVGALVAKSPAGPPPRQPARLISPPPAPEAPAASPDFGFGASPAPAPAAPAPAAPLDDFFGDAGGAGSPSAGGSPSSAPDDFFSAHSSMSDSIEPSQGGGTPGGAEHDRSLFDLPPPPPPMPRPESAIPEVASGAGSAAPKPKAKVAEAAPVGVPEPTGGARLVSMVFNGLLVGAVAWGSLVAYATYRNEMHFDPELLRPQGLRRAILGNPAELGTQLLVQDVTNGLYPTAHGKQVFYVRGQVASRSKADVSAAEVKVEVLEGSKVVATATGWVGAETGPEQLYNLTDSASLASLAQAQRAQAKTIHPGAMLPFVVALLDYPDDLPSRTLRVTVGVPPQVAQK